MAEDQKASDATAVSHAEEQDSPCQINNDARHARRESFRSRIYRWLVVFLLFLNFFLAQYDKFVLSYFKLEVIEALDLSPPDYGILSGYATGIVYAFMALPIAFVADYVEARVWVLSIAALWWSLCVLFQGLSKNFWQILLSRIGMGIGQSPVEALSISLISDIIGAKWLFVAQSLFYVGVYVGEAVSGQLATAFAKTNTPWNEALKSIGIVGIVLAVITRCILREPARRAAITPPPAYFQDMSTLAAAGSARRWKLQHAKRQIVESVSQIVHMHSFWLLTLSAGARTFAGVSFGYYMPGYLSSAYPSVPDLLSRYGIIVGVVGSFAVLAGGLICSLAGKDRAVMPLYLTSIGGFVSSIFVILMVFSPRLGGEDEERGLRILWGAMSAAYLTAELWLGAFASLLALILPARTKTFCLAIYTCTIILIYSSGPEIIGLALRNFDPGSDAYIRKTRDTLASLIPVGYWVAGVNLLLCLPLVRKDLRGNLLESGRLSFKRKAAFVAFVVFLVSLTISLFVASLVLR